ncbi:MAG: InlB B-repeat-containing protein, partial [Candidatus Riflebacteria bacterium]|nr:InlB B-repeat-containing protein [Candidatus Riflebacteria bacterium]
TEFVDFVLVSDNSNVADEADNSYVLKPIFTITLSRDFSDNDKVIIANAILINSEKVAKTWSGRVLTLSFCESLEPNTTYTIKMNEITNIEGVVINPFDDFNFTTMTDNYTIVYNLGDGVLENPNPTSYNMASDSIILNNPTLEGFEFIGWTSDYYSGASMTVTIPQGSTGDKNFTANWERD